MKNKEEDIYSILIMLAIGFGIMLLIGLVYRPLLLLVFFLVAVSLLIGGIYFMIRVLRKPEYAEDTVNIEAHIENQLELCRREIRKNKSENGDINKNIQELESDLDHSNGLDSINRQESKRILAGFYRELALRDTKKEFYMTCKSKLDTLLYNFRFSKSLQEKQAKLNELAEDHMEDIAKMESLRSDMEYNMAYLETIEKLSLKMLESNSLDSAQQLQLELKEITRELRRM